ncbi:MAG: hypothetical protein OES24_21920 [Acidimicrobiia bacterium]|nr:hypothetical protein [Acidimicrobiia bacterium]
MRFDRRRGVVAAAVAAVMLVGCSDPAPELTVDERIEQAQLKLVEAGTSPEVADCVVRLARQDLRVGPIDDLTRDELVLSCEKTQALLEGEDETDDSDSLAFVEGPDTLGDDPALDSLWLACEEGSGAACDELFEQAPVGSEYARFGVSCGDRDEVLFCSELDEEIP